MPISLSRVLRFLLAAWWFTWSTVVVPAHTRGAFGLDGSLASDAQGRRVSLFFSAIPTCCASKPGKGAPPAGPRACALCLLVANIGVTPAMPPVMLNLREFAGTCDPCEPVRVDCRKLLAYHGRAPPGASLPSWV